jgi:hypothetical protein
MQKELKFAQHNLTELVIRRFWKAMTRTFPAICVNDGMDITYQKNSENISDISKRQITNIVAKLLRCQGVHVAAPLFQYEYDPQNSVPHHVSAITLTKLTSKYILSFFDPKGRGALRKQQELYIMSTVASEITQQTGIQTQLLIYDGKNLQINDEIGLCQLFSLFYLYEYVTEITSIHNKNTPNMLHILYTPNDMVKYIDTKRKGFNSKILYAFWNAFFKIGRKLL